MSRCSQLQGQTIPKPLCTNQPARFLQRKKGPGCAKNEYRMSRQPIQRKSANYGEPSEVPPIVHQVLGSPGQPLDSAARLLMESRFGHDFSRVRVHTEAKAAESARVVNASAYTYGRHVVFGAGQYAPGTNEGSQLVAHELTHVIQQNRGVRNMKGHQITTPPARAVETEADKNAFIIVEGKQGPAIHSKVSRQLQKQGQAKAQRPTSTLKRGQQTNFYTKKNWERLAEILWGEMRGKHHYAQLAVGWTVLNRMLNRNTSDVASVSGGKQYARLKGAPFRTTILATMLLSGDYDDPTNGSENFFSPLSMPDASNEGCCSGRTGNCNTKRFQSNVDCGGGLQTVPGTTPPRQRFFPSWARPSKRQPQPANTDPMIIQVYRR